MDTKQVCNLKQIKYTLICIYTVCIYIYIYIYIYILVVGID